MTSKMLFTIIFCIAVLAVGSLAQNRGGICDLAELGCLPIKDFSFASQFPQRSPQDIGNDLNNYLLEKKWFQKNLELKLSKDGSYGIFTKENIKANEVLMRIDVGSLFWFNYFNFDLIQANDETQIHKMFKIPSFINYETNKTLLPPAFFIFSTQLLYHLYHLNQSNLREDLMALPREIDSPLFTLGKKELLSIDETISKFIIDQRELVAESYKFFREELNYYWNEEQILSFFGRPEVPPQDFIYCFFIYNSRILNNKSPEMDIASRTYIPGVNHLRPVKELKGEKTPYLEYHKEGEHVNKFLLTAPRDFSAGDEITIELNIERNPLFYMLYRGVLPEIESECVFFEVIDKNLADQWHVKNEFCLAPVNLKSVYSIGMLMNMNISTLLDCFQNFNVQKEGYNFDIIFNKCIHPEFKYVPFWEKSLNKLGEFKKQFKEHLKKLESILEEDKNCNSCRLLKEYTTRKQKVVDELLKEIDQLKIFNDSLKGKRLAQVAPDA